MFAFTCQQGEQGWSKSYDSKQMWFSSLLLFHAYMQSHSFSISNLVLAVPSTEIHEWITWSLYFQTLYINETHTHISKTDFVTSFFDVNISDFDFYILKKYLFIPLLVLCVPILWGPPLQCALAGPGGACTWACLSKKPVLCLFMALYKTKTLWCTWAKQSLRARWFYSNPRGYIKRTLLGGIK
jgi:hypothetical protein